MHLYQYRTVASNEGMGNPEAVPSHAFSLSLSLSHSHSYTHTHSQWCLMCSDFLVMLLYPVAMGCSLIESTGCRYVAVPCSHALQSHRERWMSFMTVQAQWKCSVAQFQMQGPAGRNFNGQCNSCAFVALQMMKVTLESSATTSHRK